MPEWMPPLLLCVFGSHMPFFAWRYHRTRQLRYAATTLTFVLLTISYALRVFAPEATQAGIPLHMYVRVPAWISAVVSIGLLLQHHVSRPRIPH
jgi:hypothetical protein